MKSAPLILKEEMGLDASDHYVHTLPVKNIIEIMEKYADQWKYDYSKDCKCKDSPGATWCCNLCGLPIKKVELPKKESRCCGRCDGVNDICVADTQCDLHQTYGCEICFGPKFIIKK